MDSTTIVASYDIVGDGKRVAFEGGDSGPMVVTSYGIVCDSRKAAELAHDSATHVVGYGIVVDRG
jgi:hypothetical protein